MFTRTAVACATLLAICGTAGAMIYTAPIYYVEAPDAGTPDAGGDAAVDLDGGTTADVLLTGAEPTDDAAACSCATLGV